MSPRRASTKGFTRTSSLLSTRIREASEKRGFAQSRLLTQWVEVAGDEIAAISRPVEISYGRGGMGATLTVLTTGANAPMLEMQKEQLRARVNGIYGYNAIARVRITQTAATGFAEGQADFRHGRDKPEGPKADPVLREKAQAAVGPVSDTDLREALARLGTNILMKTNR
jgi:hypothetical protein